MGPSRGVFLGLAADWFYTFCCWRLCGEDRRALSCFHIVSMITWEVSFWIAWTAFLQFFCNKSQIVACERTQVSCFRTVPQKGKSSRTGQLHVAQREKESVHGRRRRLGSTRRSRRVQQTNDELLAPCHHGIGLQLCMIERRALKLPRKVLYYMWLWGYISRKMTRDLFFLKFVLAICFVMTWQQHQLTRVKMQRAAFWRKNLLFTESQSQ